MSKFKQILTIGCIQIQYSWMAQDSLRSKVAPNPDQKMKNQLTKYCGRYTTKVSSRLCVKSYSKLTSKFPPVSRFRNILCFR